MEIVKEGNKVVAKIVGKLDRKTSPGFDTGIFGYIDSEVDEIVLDLKDAIYVSSAGLRVILRLEKEMEQRDGKLLLINVPKMVMEVLVETGLSDMLNIE